MRTGSMRCLSVYKSEWFTWCRKTVFRLVVGAVEDGCVDGATGAPVGLQTGKGRR